MTHVHQVWGTDNVFDLIEAQNRVSRAPWGAWPTDKFVPSPYWIGAAV